MKKLKVFVVDDDRDFAESLVDVLEDKGYEVETAFSGEDAVQRLIEQDFDLICIDFKMPGMNGIECLQEVRKTKPHIKVVMMTGYIVKDLQVQAREAGAIGILEKPFAIEQLIKILQEEQPAPVILVADDDPDFVNSAQEILTDNEDYFISESSIYRILKDGFQLSIYINTISSPHRHTHIYSSGRILVTRDNPHRVFLIE